MPLSFLTGLLLVSPRPAAAQFPVTNYTVSYGGGGWVLTRGYDGSQTSGSYAPLSSGGWGYFPYNGYSASDTGNVVCSGAVKATLAWAGTTPLPSVVVEEDSSASWNTEYMNSGGCGCSCGLPNSTDTSYNTGGEGGSSVGVRYTAFSNPTSVPDLPAISPSASSGYQPQYGGYFAASTSYKVSTYPVTINLTGTTPDSSGGLNVLTGGQVTATLNCPFPVTSYSWSVSGATAPNPFLTWDPTFPNSNYPTQFVPLASTDLTKDSFSFYDAHNGDNITVQCTATVQPPSGPALTVTAKSPNITYIKPSVNWVVNQSYNSIPFGFFDGLPNGPFGSRELWGPITITEPALFSVPGNSNTVGFGVVVQLASPSRSNTRVPLNGKPATYSKLSVVYANGTAGAVSSPTGLDGSFPYYGGYYKNTDGTFTPVNGNYGWLAYNDGYSGDQPQQHYRNSDQDSGGDAWNAASASDSFDTWVMYRPASVAGQGTIYVPLQKLSWNWGATASLDQYNSWGVNQPLFVSGSPANTDVYPAWSLEIPLSPTVGP